MFYYSFMVLLFLPIIRVQLVTLNYCKLTKVLWLLGHGWCYGYNSMTHEVAGPNTTADGKVASV